MSTVRRKPFTVQAVQWFPNLNLPYVCPGYRSSSGVHPAILGYQEHMPTQIVNPGDWIVTEPDGRRRVYDPASFAAAFEEEMP